MTSFDETAQSTIGDFYAQAREDGRKEGHSQGFAEGWQAALDAFEEAFPVAIKAVSSSGNIDNPLMPLEAPIEELELGIRPYYTLRRAGWLTIRDIVSKSERDLRNLPNFGPKSLEEVVEVLSRYGYKLAPSKDQ